MIVSSETNVRNWVRSLASLKEISLNFTEAARGGTTGQPDVDIHYNDGARRLVVPTELKAWDRLRNGLFRARMEPTQVRWHYVAAKQGERTLLLWGEIGTETLWVLPGSEAPRKVVDQVSDAVCFRYGWREQDAFAVDLGNGRFWSNVGRRGMKNG